MTLDTEYYKTNSSFAVKNKGQFRSIKNMKDNKVCLYVEFMRNKFEFC